MLLTPIFFQTRDLGHEIKITTSRKTHGAKFLTNPISNDEIEKKINFSKEPKKITFKIMRTKFKIKDDNVYILIE